ncbi:uncharacterized protein MYCGRDRAFT_111425, partial [Zymoseptoria tritici IPO323]
MPLKAHIPDELLSHIFSFLQPPRPEVLGRARYEHIEWALPDDLPAVDRCSATSEKQYLPQLKTDDAQHKLGLSTLNSCMRACPIAELQAFNRTLFRRPDLTRMVKFITISCDLDPDFCNSLKTCKALRTLEIIWPGMSVDYMQNIYPLSTIIDYKFIGDMICQSFPLLEKLVLDPREAYFGETCRQLRSLDLSSMARLQELAVEACALWGEHAIDSRLPQDIEAPLPGLQDVLPPSIRKLSVLVHRRCDRPRSEVEEVEEIKLQRNQMLILNGALRYLVDAPFSLRSVHLDMPSQEVHEGFDRLDEFFDELGFTRSVVNADPEVQRASPVVGTSTPKDQRVKLRDTFSMWLPGTDRWPTVVIKRLEDAKTEADLARWRA